MFDDVEVSYLKWDEIPSLNPKSLPRWLTTFQDVYTTRGRHSHVLSFDEETAYTVNNEPCGFSFARITKKQLELLIVPDLETKLPRIYMRAKIRYAKNGVQMLKFQHNFNNIGEKTDDFFQECESRLREILQNQLN